LNSGTALISNNKNKVTFSCHAHHEWTTSYNKGTFFWCKRCAQDEKKQKQEILADSQKKLDEYLQTYQQQLFKDAKERMLHKLHDTTETNARNQAEHDVAELSGNNDTSRKFSIDEAYYCNWLVNSTDEKITTFFSQLTSGEAKRKYKSLARQIHPDKNMHPKANEAMSRLTSCYRRISVGN
jgi:hypothetical protein